MGLKNFKSPHFWQILVKFQYFKIVPLIQDKNEVTSILMNNKKFVDLQMKITKIPTPLILFFKIMK